MQVNPSSSKKNTPQRLLSQSFQMAMSHLSLGVIGLGAVCFLLTNILLKELLNDYHYGVYSMVVTYLSVIYIYGLFGFEQVFMRFSHLAETNRIATQLTQLKFVSIIIAISSLLGIGFYYFYFSKFELQTNVFLVCIGSVAMIASLFMFNVLRLNKEFAMAQLLSNGWKIAMLLIALLLFLLKIHDLHWFLNLTLLSVILFGLWGGVKIIRQIHWQYNAQINPRDLSVAFLNFFISITSFSIVLFADRFIIEHKLGTQIVGDYFYLTNFILAPFTILQNYVGFKQLVKFKEDFNPNAFIQFNRRIIVFSLLLSLLLIGGIIVISMLNFLSFDFSQYQLTIVLLLLLGTIRLYSAGVLSAFEARTNIDNLKQTNIIIVSITLIASILVVVLFHTLNQIILGFIGIWLLRSVVYRHQILKQES